MGEKRDSYLCGNCGEVTEVATWTMLQRDIDTGELRDARPGESDPICVCPVCAFQHTDDDSGPGVWDGTRERCLAQREELLREVDEPHGYDWGFEWAAVLAELEDPGYEARILSVPAVSEAIQRAVDEERDRAR